MKLQFCKHYEVLKSPMTLNRRSCFISRSKVIGIELKFEPYTIKPIQTLFWRYKTLILNFVFSFDRNRLQDADH